MAGTNTADSIGGFDDNEFFFYGYQPDTIWQSEGPRKPQTAYFHTKHLKFWISYENRLVLYGPYMAGTNTAESIWVILQQWGLLLFMSTNLLPDESQKGPESPK